MKKLGEKIWRLREEKGLSQEILAEKLEVSRQTISNWENDRATLDAYKLKQLCEILGVSADELLETGENTSEEKNSESPKEEGPAEQQRDKKRTGKRFVLCLLGTVAALLLAVAIYLFTLPKKDETQVITSAFTLTPTMGGIFLLVLVASILIAVTVILLKKK